MHDPMLMLSGVLAVVARTLGVQGTPDEAGDRGAVSIEQVLWYAAAAISVVP